MGVHDRFSYTGQDTITVLCVDVSGSMSVSCGIFFFSFAKLLQELPPSLREWKKLQDAKKKIEASSDVPSSFLEGNYNQRSVGFTILKN